MNTDTEINYLDLSDDEISNMSAPAPVAAPVVVDDAPPSGEGEGQDPPSNDEGPTQEELDAEAKAAEEAATAAATKETEDEAARLAAEEEAKKNPLGQADDAPLDPPAGAAPKKDAAATGDKAEGGKPVAAAEDDKNKPATTLSLEDKAAAYDKMMAPFKANGREIQLQSPEEAIRLQQMGANYTKKMQALQPALRVVRMLENNKLMDESQLSYLIDLYQKKPEAIQKLLADSQFDPHTVDADKAATYVPGDHQVSEPEMRFQAVLDEIESTTTGKELIFEVAKQWDADSRQALFQEPQLLHVIHEQKANGLYARITSEVERRRILGELQGVPFLAAYKTVGDDLHAKGLLAQAQTVEQPKPTPVATRVATPAPKAGNGAAAKAASPTRSTPAAAKAPEVNYLELSDEAFLKSMQGRV